MHFGYGLFKVPKNRQNFYSRTLLKQEVQLALFRLNEKCVSKFVITSKFEKGEYIDRPKLTEQKKTVEHIVPLHWGRSEQNILTETISELD